ncbi:unnamed protein product [Mytilus edulis]|uniref:Uncharacterized protein n=1 Tax=Mytilus edulis TaxID=6550 RepID=A0A8S3SZS0_MYTED|nr:unnamed protein product [Mytilus edulis]
MNNQRDLQAFSLKLCHYLSEFVVGSEKVVKYRRYFYKCFDDCMKGESLECISSGSKAEGLDLPGSDLDLMILYKDFVVSEKPGDDEDGSFILDTDNASNGFALIKVSKEYSNYMNVTQTMFGFLLRNDGDKDVFCRDFKSLLSLVKCQGPSIAATIKGIANIDLVVCYSCREWPSVEKMVDSSK